MRSLRRIDQRYVDWLIAVVLGVGGIAELLTIDDLRGPLILNLALIVLVAPAALMRRRHPLAAVVLWGSVALLMAAFLTQPSELDSLFLGLIIFPWAVGSHAEGRGSVAGLVFAIGAIAVVALDADTFVWGDIFFPGVFAAMFWLAGRAVRSRSRLTAELHEATLRLHEQREAEADAAVAEERRRIAREMHDVVAHSVSTMVIQAGGARRILARDPARAVAAAALIERTRARRWARCATCSACCTQARTSPSSRRSRRCTSSRASPRARAPPGSRSSCTLRARAASCPRASSSPPIA